MSIFRSFGSFLLGALFLVTTSWGAAPQPPAENEKEKENAKHVHTPGDGHIHAEPDAKDAIPVEKTQLRKEFEAKVDAWKSAAGKHWETLNRYHSGTHDATEEEQIEWGKTEAAMRDAMDETLGAAAKLIEEDPRNYDAGEFVARSIQYRIQFDWYEQLDVAAAALLNVGETNPVLYTTAGVAAFTQNDFDNAEKYLKLAQDNDALTDISRGMLYQVDAFRARWKKEAKLREADAAADDLPRVRFNTTRGPIVIELYENEAPNTVANFISLVESGAYNNIAFYQVIKDKFAMSGDQNGDGSGNAGYRIKDEANHPDARMLTRGSIMMAKLPYPNKEENPNLPGTIPDSASNQFMIAFLPMSTESTELTCFGRIIEGIGAVSTLNRVKPEKKKNKRTITPDTIVTAEVLRKRDHEYKPETLDFYGR